VRAAHKNSAVTVAFDRTGRSLVSTDVDGRLHISDMRTENIWCKRGRPIEGVWQFAFSPDGTAIATCGDRAVVSVWDIRTGEARFTLNGHTGWVQSVAWLPQGATLASASRDGTIRLWDMMMGTCLCVLQAPGPYMGMNITGVTGVTEAQKAALRALGAVEEL
jgi:WD40 repeat protein